MPSVMRPWISAVLAAFLIGVSTVACGGSASTNDSGGAQHSVQDVYSTKLLKDIKELDQGVLTYTPLGTIETGGSTEFSVWVTDIGKKSPQQDIPALEVSRETDRVVYPQDVPTGGYVAVRIKSCVNLSCKSLSSARQPVERHIPPAQWVWMISARAPGRAQISLKVDTYLKSSPQVLREEIVLVSAKVQAGKHYTPTPSPASSPSGTASNGGGGSNAVPIWAAVITGIFAVIAAWVGTRTQKKRRRRRDQAQGG